MKKILLVLTIVGLLFSCKTKKCNADKTENKDTSTTIVMDSTEITISKSEGLSINGKFTVFFVEGIELENVVPTMKFDKNKLTGYGGCNRYFSSLNPAGSKTLFQAIGATRMYCEGIKSVVENKFLAQLGKANESKLEDKILTFSENGMVLVKARQHIEQAAKVSDGSWKVVFVAGYGSIKEEGNPTMIMKGNKISGRTGCNSYFGTVNQKDMKISFSGLGQTEMACGDDKMKLEGKFNQHLQKIDKFTMRGNMIEFYSFSKLLIRAIDEE